MTRAQLEHVIRASATVADTDHLIVIGSQSILGQFPHAPPELLVSVEADIYPRDQPERAELIEGCIGELSPFHETFGYYAQGVGPETATLPAGWETRLVPVHNENTRGATGWCLEVHDLLMAKYVAGRAKDRRFIADVISYALVDPETLFERLAALPVSDARREAIARHLDADLG